MKKLLFVVAVIFISSCDKNDGPDPVEENPLEKQQAPFGKSEVEVEVKKILFNGALEAEYNYEGKALSEERRFVSSPEPVLSQRGIFKRTDGLIQTVDVLTKSQGDSLEPSFLITYQAPTTDSLRHITRKDLRNGDTSARTFAFDKDGFITRQEQWVGTKETEKTSTFYIRDAQQNVSKSWVIKGSEPKSNEIEYAYDDHPNPFFKIGQDSYGEISVRSLSRNNPVREIHSVGTRVTSNTYYTYEYLPNGYPSKVTVRVESVSFPPYSYSIGFGY